MQPTRASTHNSAPAGAGRTPLVMLAHLLLLAFATLLLSGCASVRFGSTFTQDGPATHTLEMTIPRASMNAQDIARVERQIADIEINARAGGLTTVRIDNPDSLGIRVTNTTHDALDAAAALNAIFNTLGLGGDSGPVAPFQGSYQRVSDAVGGSAFELNLVVNGELLYAAAAGVAPGHPQFTTPEGVRELIEIRYTATMPGKVSETNGSHRGDSQVEWTVPLRESTTLHVQSSVGQDTPWILTSLTIAAAFVVVALAAAAVWSVLHRQRRLGRYRLPFALRVADGDPPPAGMPLARQPRSLAEVTDALRAVLRRVARGERLDRIVPAVQRRHLREGEEVARRGADAEGN